MVKIYAKVHFKIDDKPAQAILTEGGWSVKGHPRSQAPATLNRLASPARFGPADGDPITRVAAAAALLLGGQSQVLIRGDAKAKEGAVY